MFGAWGNATASRGGKLLQLRALDWDVDGPFKNYPAVVVYHPSNASDGHAFANVGFTGWAAAAGWRPSPACRGEWCVPLSVHNMYLGTRWLWPWHGRFSKVCVEKMPPRGPQRGGGCGPWHQTQIPRHAEGPLTPDDVVHSYQK